MDTGPKGRRGRDVMRRIEVELRPRVYLNWVGPAVAAMAVLLAGCQTGSSDASDAADADQLVEDVVVASHELMNRYEHAADVLAAVCMERAGFDYPFEDVQVGPVNGVAGGPDGSEADRRAWSEALFGDEEEAFTVTDLAGKPILEVMTGGCLGQARDEVSSRADWVLLTQLQWEAESLDSSQQRGVLPFGLGPKPDVTDKAAALHTRLEQAREKIMPNVQAVLADPAEG